MLSIEEEEFQMMVTDVKKQDPQSHPAGSAKGKLSRAVKSMSMRAGNKSANMYEV